MPASQNAMSNQAKKRCMPEKVLIEIHRFKDNRQDLSEYFFMGIVVQRRKKIFKKCLMKYHYSIYVFMEYISI